MEYETLTDNRVNYVVGNSTKKRNTLKNTLVSILALGSVLAGVLGYAYYEQNEREDPSSFLYRTK